MKVRICPLCDQPMKKAHHCDSCDSFIWKPLYMDIHYNTGTMQEEDCSYDVKEHDYEYHDDGSVTMMPSEDGQRAKGRKFRGVKEIEFPAQERDKNTRQKSSAGTTRKKGGCFKMLIIFFVCFTLISSVVQIINAIVWDVISEVEPMNTPEEDLAIELPYDDDAASTKDWIDGEAERTDLTVEEVRNGGSECTVSEHMDVTLDDFTLVFEPLAAEKAAIIGSLDSYSEETDNYAYHYEGTSLYTYFNTYRMYDIDSDIGYYYDVSWDTYSGRLHEVAYDIYDSDVVEEFFAITMEALCGDGEAHRNEFQKQRSIAETEEYVFFETDGYEVYINYYDGSDGFDISYYVSIVKVM